ncbi:MAG: hypothetical protein JW902_07215, partial [Syntrophaceae bacterium]|nr:hypothetical protein [Syntrophaceae bacterium]
MFIKSDIRKVTIALEKSLGTEVYTRLGRAGIIHLARLQTGDVLMDTKILEEEKRTRDILAGCDFILNALQIEIGEAFGTKETRDREQDSAFISRATKIMRRWRILYSGIQKKAAIVKEQTAYAEALDRMRIDPGAIKKARLVRMVFGQVTDTVPDLREDVPFILAGAGRYVFGTALPQDVPQMLQFLNGYGFLDKTGDISGESLEILKRRQAVLNHRLDVLDRYIDVFRKETGAALKQLYHSYKGYDEVLEAMRLALFSERAMFITGWLDARDKQRLLAILRETCGARFVISEEKDPDAPVRLMNNRLFKPFEIIVKMLGMPANSEIDPTPLAAVTFVLIFGLMFGDLGQGLVLATAGLVLKFIAKKKARDVLGQTGGILIACGLCAAFCGILYGSLFSSEHLIPALWIHPAENIVNLFPIIILLGAFIIVVGLCVNIINALINADYSEALFGKRGMAILILYSTIVLLAVRYAHYRQVPALWEIGTFIIIPLVVFTLRGVLGAVLFHVPRPHDISEYVITTATEIIEIVLGMFANTISFIRVGAFALAHAGLSIVTYTLAGMADPALRSLPAIMILIAGNLFIIGFEGLI